MSSTDLTSTDIYLANAEDCMRQAAIEKAESDKPLWATLARSWLQLGEHAVRMSERSGPEPAEQRAESPEKKRKKKKN